MENSALCTAISNRDEQAVRAILESGRAIPYDETWRALYVATYENLPSFVRLLLRNPRFIAAASDRDFLEQLVENGPIDILADILAQPGITAAQAYGRFSYLVSTAILFEKEDFLVSLLARDDFDALPDRLGTAVKERNIRAIELLVADKRCPAGAATLTDAALKQDAEIVKAVLHHRDAAQWFGDALRNFHRFHPRIGKTILDHPRFRSARVGQGVLRERASAALAEAARLRRVDIAALLLGDARIVDDAHEAVKAAAANQDRRMLLLLLAHCGKPEERHAAAQAACLHAPNRETFEFIRDVMMHDNNWWQVVYGILPAMPDLDEPILDKLATVVRIPGKTLARLHANDWLVPIVRSTFGRGCTGKHYGKIFQWNYAKLARFAAVSSTPRLSPGMDDRTTSVPMDDVMQYIIRQMTWNLPEHATDVLWQQVCERKPKRLSEELDAFLSALAHECGDRLSDAALALPREPATQITVHNVKTLRFRMKRFERFSAELLKLQTHPNPRIQETAANVTESLNAFLKAMEQGGNSLNVQREQSEKKLNELQLVLSNAGVSFVGGPQLFAAVQEFLEMTPDEIWSPDFGAALHGDDGEAPEVAPAPATPGARSEHGLSL